MNDFNEYECLKNIYSRMTMLTAIAPIAIAFFGPFLLLYILIPNIFLYAKYYRNKNNYSELFNMHIKNLLKKSVSSIIVLFIFLLPLISMAFIDFTKIYQGTAYLILMASMISLIFGLLISWSYYLWNLTRNSSTFDKSMFVEDLLNDNSSNH